MEGEKENNFPSFSFEKATVNWLKKALQLGINEKDFWEMTLGELQRLFEAKQEVYKARAREKAENNYILAGLIGINFSRIFDASVEIPPIEEIYPDLFDAEQAKEEKENKKQELSVLRFKQFAQTFNKKFEKEVER